MFDIGDEVECVDNRRVDFEGVKLVSLLVLGQHYIVDAMERGDAACSFCGDRHDFIGVGVTCPCGCGNEVFYCHQRFRLIRPRRSLEELFTMTGAPAEPELEDA